MQRDPQTITPAHMPAAMTNRQRTSLEYAEKRNARRERVAHAAAFDTMCAARPLTPPPLPRVIVERRASEIALAADIRSGAYRG